MVDVQDFANPRSMITPGVAGAITVFITNAVGAQFSLPLNRLGLAISFLLGLKQPSLRALRLLSGRRCRPSKAGCSAQSNHGTTPYALV
jgi:hypothetical protein